MVCVHMYVQVHKYVDIWRSGAHSGVFSIALKCVDWAKLLPGSGALWCWPSLPWGSCLWILCPRVMGSCPICPASRGFLGIPIRPACLSNTLLGHLSSPPNKTLSRVNPVKGKLVVELRSKNLSKYHLQGTHLKHNEGKLKMKALENCHTEMGRITVLASTERTLGETIKTLEFMD